jgi:hypothetical protein
MDHGATTGWRGLLSGAGVGGASERAVSARRVRVLGLVVPVCVPLLGPLAMRAVLSVQLVRAAFEYGAVYLLAGCLQWARWLCSRPILYCSPDAQVHLIVGSRSGGQHRLAGRSPDPVFHAQGSRAVVSHRWSTVQAPGRTLSAAALFVVQGRRRIWGVRHPRRHGFPFRARRLVPGAAGRFSTTYGT